MKARHLCVERFISDFVGAVSLRSALDTGLIDLLLRHPSATREELSLLSRADSAGLGMLLHLLRANQVVEERDGCFSLTDAFRAALVFRDLIEAKLEMAALAAADVAELFTGLLTEFDSFLQRSRVFQLFRYDRCFDSTPENVLATRRWMRFTTALTRYESQSCIDRVDLSLHRRMLDVGGNSGEFALRICRAHPRIEATVVDLPVVCAVGAEHVGKEAEAARIRFIEASRSGKPLPAGFDLISFKSMLHDWPDDDAREFLARAHQALEAGGRLLIFERTNFQPNGFPLPYSALPIMLFWRSYRVPEFYAHCLAELGMHDIRVQKFDLDAPFMLLTAIK